MFHRCLFCHRDLPANETLEHFPIGRRVAYDPARGRLWAVCPGCRRWNLAPIEERWEALEDLERLVHDSARLLSQTDNIALLRSGELEIVRVGRANLTEEAWWRYGAELLRRRRMYQALTAAGIAGVLGLMAGGAAAGIGVFGGWWMLGRVGKQLPKLSRTLRFGRTAWRGRGVCERCGAELTSLPFRSRGVVVPRPDGEDSIALQVRCTACGWSLGAPHVLDLKGEAGRLQTPDDRLRPAGLRPSGFLITGVEAEHVLRRILAYQNYAGARESEVRRATSLIQAAGSASSLTRRLAGRGRELASMVPDEAIALEIAVNEDQERRLLELEVAALEARWKEEEEIAAISDGELTWVPGNAGQLLRETS